jgi:hypothetical protein
MPELNALIRDIPIPLRMARRPINRRGFPVPWFVTEKDASGDWDFVNLHPLRVVEAVRRNVCFLCGDQLGKYMAFVIGPMCSINRVSSEPPVHKECAEYAVRACPFLVNPNTRRNAKAAADPTGKNVPGIMIQHNPGVNLIWITTRYTIEHSLFFLGEPVSVAFFKQGRTATRAEIDAAIDKGLPYLRKAAAAENALPDLEIQIARAMPLLPAE